MNRVGRFLQIAAAVLAGLLALPALAAACPVCFGQSDSPAAQAVNMGILILLGVTMSVLVAFAAFFVYLARRARLHREAEADGWIAEMANAK
jgi:hypothetical protein